MTRARQLALDLLYYCKRTGNWEPDITDRPTLNLLEELASHPDYERFFAGDTAYLILIARLDRPELQGQTTFSNGDADHLLSALRDGLSANATRHWIVVPLRYATLSRTIRSRDFVLIAGSRDEKIDVLRGLARISPTEANYRALHTERSRSPGFFENPLLAIKIDHQTPYVEDVARAYALWSTCSLQAIFWGYLYPRERYFGSALPVREESRHLAIYAKDEWRFRHKALYFRAECRFNLDWLNRRSHKKRFRDLFRSVVAPIPKDNLTFRFFRALRFFGKATDAERDTELFEGMGITLLYLMIAAEAVLLHHDYEKRLRLTVLLPRLAKLPDHTLTECASAVDQAYRWRSDFVHKGLETYRDWEDDLSEGVATRNAMLVKRMVARLLSDAPKHIERIRQETGEDPSRMRSQWFRFLRNEWDKALGLC